MQQSYRNISTGGKRYRRKNREIRKIEWTDIDDKNQTIAINLPEKGSRARTVRVLEKTIVMVKNLKKNHGDYIFNPTFVSQRKTFNRTRKEWLR